MRGFVKRALTALVLVSICSLLSQFTSAQVLNTGDQATAALKMAPDLKIFEAATALANTLTSWAFVMIGSSILVVLGTSYYRPTSKLVRISYLMFLPAWGFLSWSVYAGTRVQSVYLAALYQRAPKVDMLKDVLNTDAIAQIDRMELGLLCFGVWLTSYLFWWIFHTDPAKEPAK